MSTRNPFALDTNNDNAAFRLGRPGRHIAAYAGLSDEALEVARQWFDQETESRKAAAERKARIEAAMNTPEAEQVRKRMAANF